MFKWLTNYFMKENTEDVDLYDWVEKIDRDLDKMETRLDAFEAEMRALIGEKLAPLSKKLRRNVAKEEELNISAPKGGIWKGSLPHGLVKQGQSGGRAG